MLIFSPKFTQDLFLGMSYFDISKKRSYKVKIKKFLIKQKLQKTIYIYLSLTCFLFTNWLTTIYLKTII